MGKLFVSVVNGFVRHHAAGVGVDVRELSREINPSLRFAAGERTSRQSFEAWIVAVGGLRSASKAAESKSGTDARARAACCRVDIAG